MLWKWRIEPNLFLLLWIPLVRKVETCTDSWLCELAIDIGRISFLQSRKFVPELWVFSIYSWVTLFDLTVYIWACSTAENFSKLLCLVCDLFDDHRRLDLWRQIRVMHCIDDIIFSILWKQSCAYLIPFFLIFSCLVAWMINTFLYRLLDVLCKCFVSLGPLIILGTLHLKIFMATRLEAVQDWQLLVSLFLWKQPCIKAVLNLLVQVVLSLDPSDSILHSELICTFATPALIRLWPTICLIAIHWILIPKIGIEHKFLDLSGPWCVWLLPQDFWQGYSLFLIR